VTRRWVDTLFTRLFLLMVLALVGSQLVAWFIVTRAGLPAQLEVVAPPRDTPGSLAAVAGRDGDTAAERPTPPARPPLPTLGSLPPTPGLPPDPAAPGPSSGLPPLALALDYGVRLLVLAAAAAWGARWLSRPVHRMVRSADAMSKGLARGIAPVLIDESEGCAEVRDTARVFNQMASRLAEAFHGRGLLMAAISHDLRTPLTRIRIRLEGLLPDARAQRCVEDVREMNGLIDSAIDVFRAGDDADEALQATDLLALVQSLVDDLSETGQTVPLQGHGVLALCRPRALRRALDNLVGNALRHAGSAEITVLSLQGPRILIEDRGNGIPDLQLQQVLEPFYRLDPSRSRDTGGSGLGLHIARTLLEGQGASLHLSNRSGGGLRAEVRLTAAPPR
jgi:signal transduction histidine kinase